MWLSICAAWPEKESVIMCSCVCTDWGTYRLALWQMYRTSCIIYVCSFSYAQKPDVLSISGSLRRKHVGTRRRKPNNNKQVFSVTNSSHFGTNNKRTFSGLSAAGGLKVVFFQRNSASVFLYTLSFSLCLSVFLSISGRRGSFFCCCIACVVSRSLLESSFGRATASSLRAKQTAVAYG